MKIPIYENIDDFKDNYLIDFSEYSKDTTLIKYLRYCENIYSKEKEKTKYIYSLSFSESTRKINNILSTKENLHYHRMLFSQEREFNHLKQFRDYYSALTTITPINENHKDTINDYALSWKKVQYEKNKIDNKRKDINKIFLFIKSEIEKEKSTILRFQGNEQIQSNEPEPLSIKQVQKIGLLFRTGIIDFLREKNPKITNNQIAGFLDLLTSERIKQSSIGSHLSKESNKYPIKNKKDEDDLDLLLKRFGISPQS